MFEPRIGVGDLLKVSILGVPEFDQDLRVNGSGDMHIALLGVVHVAGLTTEQAQQVIRDRLMEGDFFVDPQVSVFEKEYATQGVSVLGEVLKPGVYPITGPRRLFDILSLAGGTTPKAGLLVSITPRDQPNATRNVNLSRDPAKNLEANVEIRPGDTVVVSKAGVVYVVGAVRLPTGIILENGGNITVLQAIAVAGGTSPTASLKGARIIRRTPGGPLEIPMNLKTILSAKAPDVTLEAEDIVFVPESGPKKAAGAVAQAAIRIAGSIASYSVFY
jgi:polysaccharide export outer membrane protein